MIYLIVPASNEASRPIELKNICRVGRKSGTFYCPCLRQMLTDFQNSFNAQINGQLAIRISHHSLTVTLHYLVKYKCTENQTILGSMRVGKRKTLQTKKTQ